MCKYCSAIEGDIKYKICSSCRSVYYCSKECQIKDWKEHKNECNHSTKDALSMVKKVMASIHRNKDIENIFRIYCIIAHHAGLCATLFFPDIKSAEKFLLDISNICQYIKILNLPENIVFIPESCAGAVGIGTVKSSYMFALLPDDMYSIYTLVNGRAPTSLREVREYIADTIYHMRFRFLLSRREDPEKLSPSELREISYEAVAYLASADKCPFTPKDRKRFLSGKSLLLSTPLYYLQLE